MSLFDILFVINLLLFGIYLLSITFFLSIWYLFGINFVLLWQHFNTNFLFCTFVTNLILLVLIENYSFQFDTFWYQFVTFWYLLNSFANFFFINLIPFGINLVILFRLGNSIAIFNFVLSVTKFNNFVTTLMIMFLHNLIF